MRQFTCPKAVTHPSTNRARCRATALIETNALPLHQTANHFRLIWVSDATPSIDGTKHVPHRFQVDSSSAAASRSSGRAQPRHAAAGRQFARKRDARSPASCKTRCAETTCAESWPTSRLVTPHKRQCRQPRIGANYEHRLRLSQL